MAEEMVLDEQTVDEEQLVLTVIDNPFNPKTEYDEWKQWDESHGYYTEQYIARLLSMEEDYDDDDEFTMNLLVSKVINEILENDVIGMYRLV